MSRLRNEEGEKVLFCEDSVRKKLKCSTDLVIGFPSLKKKTGK